MTELAVTYVYGKCLELIRDKQTLNVGDVMALVPKLMDAAKEFPNLTGPEKRKIVLDVVAKIVNDQTEVPIDPNAKTVLIAMLQSEVFGEIVDQLWSAAKGLLFKVVGKNCENVRGCFRKCGCLC